MLRPPVVDGTANVPDGVPVGDEPNPPVVFAPKPPVLLVPLRTPVPVVDGTLPVVDGTLPVVDGTLPAVDGTLPVVDGMLPAVDGTSMVVPVAVDPIVPGVADGVAGAGRAAELCDRRVGLGRDRRPRPRRIRT